MKQEKVVIFDWGGVIESHKEGEYNWHSAIEAIIKRLTNNKVNSDIIKLWNNCWTLKDGQKISETSNLDDINYWFNNIKNKFNIDCSFENFINVYKEEYMKVYYYKEVVEYAHSLKDKCKIGILSNLSYLDKGRIDMQVNLNMFDYVWLSFDLKCRKPDEIIYEKVEATLKYENKNILFIDDTLVNIETAKKRGWNTCHASGYELDKIKESVEHFLCE